MKKLVSSTGFKAEPITKIKELKSINQDEVAGIVISTTLSSSVKEKYWEVIKLSASLFPDKPIFLASYATERSTRITATSHFKEASLDYDLLSINEAKSIPFNTDKQILILTQKEISDPIAFRPICELMKRLLMSSTLTQD